MSQLRGMIESLSIQTKDIGVKKLHLNWAQEQYLHTAESQLRDNGRIRIIVLKARQLGISTITEALAFCVAFLFDRYRVLVVAHDNDSSEGLLGMTNLYWESCAWHDYYSTKHLSTSHIKWNENQSSMKVATAGNKNVGRSKTIHFLHASEFAFWKDPATTFLGLRQAIPEAIGTGIVLESTANGIGNEFQTTWEASSNGDTEYIPLFFPWHKHPEYLASQIGRPYHQLGPIDDEEKALRGIGISDDRLAWRRWAIRNKCKNDIEKFHQEYPTTPDEAFISTGRNVFPYPKLRPVYEPMIGVTGQLHRNGLTVKFIEDPNGPLRVFRFPSEDLSWGQYFIGADPTQTTRGDHAVAQVINRHNLEQVAVWRWRIDPGNFAEELFKLALYYNTPPVAVEKEGPGGLTNGKLLGMHYPRVWQHAKIDKTPGKVTGDTYGWSTTAQTKHIAVGRLLELVVDNTITVHDQVTFQEMKNYMVLDNGEYGPAAEDGFDDAVMGLAIAVTCHFLSPPPTPYGYHPPETADGSMSGDPTDNLADQVLNGQMPWDAWEQDDEEMMS